MTDKTTEFIEKLERLKTKTFVFEGEEVVLTGRVAAKTLPSSKVKEIYEIEPKNKVPYGNTRNKWVAITDLFEVQ
jgi:hypothetical protein